MPYFAPPFLQCMWVEKGPCWVLMVVEGNKVLGSDWFAHWPVTFKELPPSSLAICAAAIPGACSPRNLPPYLEIPIPVALDRFSPQGSLVHWDSEHLYIS